MTVAVPELGEPLTPREIDVLETLARRGHQGETASELGISVQTVKHHLSTIYTKLGVNSAIEAFRATGWLALPGDEFRAAERTAARQRAALERLEAVRTELVELLRAPDSGVIGDGCMATAGPGSSSVAGRLIAAETPVPS